MKAAEPPLEEDHQPYRLDPTDSVSLFFVFRRKRGFSIFKNDIESGDYWLEYKWSKGQKKEGEFYIPSNSN